MRGVVEVVWEKIGRVKVKMYFIEEILISSWKKEKETEDGSMTRVSGGWLNIFKKVSL